MGVNTLIQLPNYTITYKLLQVMARLLGHEFQKETFEKKPFNPDLPASEDNGWHLKFPNLENKITLDTSSFHMTQHSMTQLVFQDIANQTYRWSYFLDTEYEQYRLLMPGANPESIIIGKKLIDFFGGKVVFYDSGDEDDPKNYYRKKRGNMLYPRRTKDQSSNDRWFQFYNALNNFQPINSKDLKQTMDRFGSSPRLQQWFKTLQILEQKAQLEQDLPEGQNKSTKKLKL